MFRLGAEGARIRAETLARRISLLPDGRPGDQDAYEKQLAHDTMRALKTGH